MALPERQHTGIRISVNKALIAIAATVILWVKFFGGYWYDGVNRAVELSSHVPYIEVKNVEQDRRLDKLDEISTKLTEIDQGIKRIEKRK